MGKKAPSTRRLGVYINWKVRITSTDGRLLTGTLIGFDKHQNCIVLDAEETRTVKNKKLAKDQEYTRTIGFCVVRGDTILSVECIEKPKKGKAAKKEEPAKALPKLAMPFPGMGKGMPNMMAGMPKMPFPMPGGKGGMPAMPAGMMPPLPGMGGMPMPGLMPKMPMPGMGAMPG